MPILNIERVVQNLRHLDALRFARLCNALLAGTAAPHMDRSHLRLNLQITEPDGGVDAACEGAPRAVGRLIPARNVVYQFKSGADPKSAAAIAEQDVLGKPRVCAALEAGKAFVYVSARARGDAFGEEITAEVRARGLAVADGQILYVGADLLAELLVPFPALAAGVGGWDAPLATLEQWARREAMRPAYQVDADVAARLDGIRALLAPERAVTRLVGAAGDGKTRAALEALRGSELEDSILYASSPDEVDPGLLSYLERTPDVRCTLVVDEAEDGVATRLADRWSGMPAGARLLLIGLDASGVAQPGTVQITRLSDDLVTALVRSIAHGAPDEVTARVARACEGSPKLAVLLAGRIRDDASLAFGAVWLADGGMRQLLDRFLPLDEAGDDWAALSATALLTRVGWAGDVDGDSELLFGAAGLDPARARAHVDRAHRRFGIAPLAGRYRYVSPQVLADHLAARRLRSWTRGRFAEFFGALRPAMRDSFVRRLRGLAAESEIRATVEAVVFGPEGPFPNLAALEEDAHTGWGGSADLLRRLAGAYPNAAVRALERVIGGATPEALAAATGCRRNVVWALEQLLWPDHTFERAAALLLSLAASENESWGNNASSVFAGTFQTILGGTAAGPDARVRVLRRAASSASAAGRRLAAQAIGRALHVGHENRTGGPPDDVPNMPREAWRPATYDEWARTLASYLAILQPLLDDEDSSVRVASAAAVAAGVDGAVQLPWLTDAWCEVARSFAAREDAMRYPLVRRVEERVDVWRLRAEHARHHARSGNADPDRSGGESSEEGGGPEEAASIDNRLRPIEAVVASLRGDDFASRLRTALARRPALAAAGEEARAQAVAATEAELEALAREALAAPECLDPQWAWMHGGPDPERTFVTDRWVRTLARVDDARVAADHLARRARDGSPGGAARLAAYELVYADTRGEDDLLDRRAAAWRAFGLPATFEFDLLARARPSAARLDRLVALLAGGDVPGREVERLSYYGWGNVQTPADVTRLARAAAAEPGSLGPVFRYVAQHLRHRPADRVKLAPLAFELLERGSAGAAAVPGGDVRDLAAAAVAHDPLRVARAALGWVTNDMDDLREARAILDAAWAADNVDRRALFSDVVGPLLDRRDLWLWTVCEALRGFPVGDLGDELPLAWVDAAPDRRAYVLACLLGAPADRASDLHALLLERYRDHHVDDAFRSAAMSGMWVGSRASRTRHQLERARAWAADPRPAVRAWGEEMVRLFEGELQRDEQEEAEERLFQ